MTCKITAQSGALLLSTPYSADLVADLKTQVPSTDRRFDPTSKGWIVSPAFGDVLTRLVLIHFGETVHLPQTKLSKVAGARLLDVRYVGQCKARDDGTVTASGWYLGGWNVVFPEQSLRDWFEAGPAEVTPQAKPQAAGTTLYALLSIKQGATADEIRTGYRRVSKQWHPDLNKEPDAVEMFLKIQHAYEVLSAQGKRERYDAGLAFEATLKKQKQKPEPKPDYAAMSAGAYRAPLRCGYILAEGQDTIGRFVVDKILMWEDIVNPAGQSLVPSYPMGAKAPVEAWS